MHVIRFTIEYFATYVALIVSLLCTTCHVTYSGIRTYTPYHSSSKDVVSILSVQQGVVLNWFYN